MPPAIPVSLRRHRRNRTRPRRPHRFRRTGLPTRSAVRRARSPPSPRPRAAPRSNQSAQAGIAELDSEPGIAPGVSVSAVLVFTSRTCSPAEVAASAAVRCAWISTSYPSIVAPRDPHSRTHGAHRKVAAGPDQCSMSCTAGGAGTARFSPPVRRPAGRKHGSSTVESSVKHRLAWGLPVARLESWQSPEARATRSTSAGSPSAVKGLATTTSVFGTMAALGDPVTAAVQDAQQRPSLDSGDDRARNPRATGTTGKDHESPSHFGGNRIRQPKFLPGSVLVNADTRGRPGAPGR